MKPTPPFRALAELQRRVVAVAHGAVAGAGLGIMLSCHLVVAAPTTKLVFAYPSVGLTPDCGVSWLPPRAVGRSGALGGRPLHAEEVLAWGMVTEFAEDAHARGREVAAALVAGPAGAFGAARHLLRPGG